VRTSSYRWIGNCHQGRAHPSGLFFSVEQNGSIRNRTRVTLIPTTPADGNLRFCAPMWY
jgi:hypothetical protein